MSKNLVWSLALALGFASAVRAVEAPPEPKSYVVETSVLAPFFGTYNAYFFFRAAPSLAVGPVIGYYNATGSDHTKGTGFKAGIEANWFLTGSAISNGWRVVPSIRYESDSFTHGSGTGKDSGVALGLEGGYRWVCDFGLTMGFSFGIDFDTFGKQLTLSDGYVLSLDRPLQIATGVAPTANVTIGYAF